MLRFPVSRDGLVYDRPSYAHEAFPEGTSWPRPLLACSPCVGLDTPKRAALELGIPWKSTNMMDLRRDLRGCLSRLHGGSCQAGLGPISGNVMQVNMANLTDADCLVSGPPCPPYSSMGLRGRGLDPRSDVLQAVGEQILILARRGCLAFFILENVEGMYKRAAGEDISYGHRFKIMLSDLLPEGWAVKLCYVNARDTGVPHHRPRVFLIGARPEMLATPSQRLLWGRQPRRVEPVPLRAALDPIAEPSDYEGLTINQKLNVDERLREWEDVRHRREPPAEIAIVDIARDTAKKFDGDLGIDESHTLRLNNAHLWIVPASHLYDVYGKKGRLLTFDEKCRLCGIVPQSLGGLSPSSIETALGNCIPVPLIGTVMVPLLRAWLEMHRSHFSSLGALPQAS